MSAMEKQIKSQMDIISARDNDDDMHSFDHDKSIYSMAGYTLSAILPSAIYSLLPFAKHISNLKNSPVMITVGNELFFANASSLLLYEYFSEMIYKTSDYTSQGFPKLRINRNSKHFSDILEYIEGIIYFCELF